MKRESAIYILTCRFWLLVLLILERAADLILVLARLLEQVTDVVVTLHDRAEGYLNESMGLTRAAVECLEKER